MAEHFKLEITNRSTKITTWTGVSADFADEFRENLAGSDASVTDNKPMSDAIATIFSVANKASLEEDKISPTINKSTKKNDGKYAKYNYAKRVKQRRSKFKTLAYINFMIPNVQFVTLTFDSRMFEGADDLDTCHKAFQKFIKRVRHQYDDFRYLAVFSRQRNKHWHYHMLCNFDETVSGKTIREIWSYGIVHCFLQVLFGESCKVFLEKVASPNWRKLQSPGWLHSKPAASHCRHYLIITAQDMETEAPNSHLRVHVP